jgi:hypothetical protein
MPARTTFSRAGIAVHFGTPGIYTDAPIEGIYSIGKIYHLLTFDRMVTEALNLSTAFLLYFCNK